MIAFIFEGLTIVGVLVALFFLMRTQLKLKRDYQILQDVVRDNSNDIAGLCSAAVTVDSRIAAKGRQINGLAEKIAETKQNEQAHNPYSVDIERVRSGASVDDLMQNSGLTHDEAALLIRLHVNDERAESEQNDQPTDPYSINIQKARNGASVNELMQNSGLSHDEAALLVRLHVNDSAIQNADEEQNEPFANNPYGGDIRKAKSGASVNELMQNSGLSRDEAALLIRLHGSKTQSR